VPPPKYRDTEASKHKSYLDADLDPVPDRRGISMNDAKRRVEKRVQNPVHDVTAEDRDLSLDKAIPQVSAAIDAQVDRHDASNDFIKEELHLAPLTQA
jgi:hypothetical protein